MEIRNFWKSGHWPTLLGSFLYFDVSFMVWVLMGATSVYITQDLQLTASQKGFMVALPILGGSIMRVVMGLLADRIGAKRSAVLGMSLTLIPLFLLWMFGTTLYEVYAYGFLLGIAGASFAVALPLASRWYPPRYQGLALGIAGAGNSGTVFATLFAPRLAEYFGGWHAVFGLAMIPVSLVLAGFVLLAKDAPNPPPAKPLREYVRMVRVKDVWLFCFFYSITFGGFVGMVSFLPLFFHEQYQLPTIRSGDFVTFCVIAGSFFRPIGGWLADKWGGVRILQTLFLCILTLFLCVSAMFSLRLELLFLLLIMASFGLGNGAVFQLVPQRFAEDIGIVTGIVGAAGGVGGFFLPSLLGVLKDMTGTYTPGFIVLAVIVGLALFTMLAVSQRWSESLVKKTSTGSAV
ncbi:MULTISPECIES: MFS transporter [Aneurinibacillus]|jgi:NNP family nitrate/nitrite transporter-like MFS transporter|uniref:Nitrate transporter n=1 Tax=Aneurinibacillus danicus TaxID=267746 RepID=A0A511V7G9_9BACL|nr:MULTISPECIES: nitrate/nitrite transporter [Aneurinibacillus]GEN34895.1 nitrate transporter [Aneurinibacillus danicus]